MLKVLVVDDDENILKLIKMRLEVEGYKVETASNAEAALDREGRDIRCRSSGLQARGQERHCADDGPLSAQS